MSLVEKAFSRWLILTSALLLGASAGSLGACLWLDRETSQAVQADLLRYQIGGEWQHWHVPIFSDLEALPVQFQAAFLEATPYRWVAGDGLCSGADNAEASALVIEVLTEWHIDLSMLVAQGHCLTPHPEDFRVGHQRSTYAAFLAGPSPKNQYGALQCGAGSPVDAAPSCQVSPAHAFLGPLNDESRPCGSTRFGSDTHGQMIAHFSTTQEATA